MASAVQFEPVPAITGTRPAVASMQTSTMRRCSAWFSVGDSPVVPHGTRASVPWLICQSISARNAYSSNAPSLNGVIKATIEPLNIP